VRCESAAAVRYWWGISSKAIWHWRQALGVSLLDSAGTRRLVRQSARAGARVLQARGRAAAAAGKRRRPYRTPDPRGCRPDGAPWPWRTAGQLALLGTMPDHEVAARIGRSPSAVRNRRVALGIPTFRGGG
jgi:hypothetical protein